MRDTCTSSPSIVVGIDGSRKGLTAALWAIDEAVQRDIPLRLVHAIEPNDTATEVSARRLAAAETAVRMAVGAVESTNRRVKIEIDILRGRPAEMLLEAGRAAAMICVGPIGIKNATARRIGSTAAALATRAHCPVAVIRGVDPLIEPRSIVAEIDSPTDSVALLECSFHEALLRNAPLVIVSVWQSDAHVSPTTRAVAERNRLVRAELNRSVAMHTRKHPELDVTTVATHGTFLKYFSQQAHSTQLVVVGRRRAHGVAEIVGLPCFAALRDTDCSILVCDPNTQL